MSYQSAILARTPSAYWPFTETSGSVFADVTGNGHDATLAAGADVTVTPAGDGGAQSGQSALSLAVAGAMADAHALTLGRPASLPFAAGYTGGAWSVEWWTRDVVGNSDGLSMRVSTVADLDLAWGLTQQSSFSVGVSAFVFHDAAFASVVGGYDAAHPGCWHHWVITWTGLTLSLYRDGAPVAWDTTNGDVSVFGAAGAFTPDTAFINLVGGAQYSLNHLAIYPVALDADAVKANYWAAWPRQDAACFGASGLPNPPPPAPAWLRLRHASGRSYVQQNGEQVQVVAGAVGVLDLPLPALPTSPPTLVGKDPATGLPAFCPAPIPTTTTVVLGGGGGSQPAPAPQCVQVRCGVSGACRDHLVSLYQDWSHWLDPLFQAAATFGVAVAVATVPWDWLLDLEAGAVIKSGIVTLLQGFGSAITGNVLPVLDQDLQTDIQRALFDHLACVNDQVQVSADNVAAWKAALDALTTWPIASLAGPFCGLLLQYTPLARWQAAASTASPSTACDAWP